MHKTLLSLGYFVAALTQPGPELAQLRGKLLGLASGHQWVDRRYVSVRHGCDVRKMI